MTAAGHSDDGASLWAFTHSTNGWDGTPLQLDSSDDWVYGIDVYETLIAVTTNDRLWIGNLF